MKQPRLLERAETHTESQIQTAHTCRSRDYLQDYLLFRSRAQSWSHSSTTKDPKQSPSAPQKASGRTSPNFLGCCQGASRFCTTLYCNGLFSIQMNSKKQKKQSGCMECKVVDSRFSSTSIDEAKLSVNSRLHRRKRRGCTWNVFLAKKCSLR